jgi:hypothetical protein
MAVAAVAAMLVGPAAGAATRPVSRISTVWSASQVRLDVPATVHGRVTSAHLQRRTVGLYVSLRSGWRRVGGTVSDSAGRYRVTVPTHFYYSRALQVRASGTPRARGVTSASHPFTVVPAFTPAGADTAWARWHPGQEWRFNPCRSVTYRVNATGAAPGALDDVRSAFKRAHEATGIWFRYLGTTTAFPNGATPYPVDTAVVVAWGNDADTGWSMGPDVLSTGGVLATVAARDGQGAIRRIARAGVILNTAQNDWLASHSSTQMRVRVLEHEIGGILGLGPVTARYQRMNEGVLPTDTVHWGAGDLTGLRRVGLVEGCVTDTK